MSRTRLDVPSDLRGCDPGHASAEVVHGVHLHVEGVPVSPLQCGNLVQNQFKPKFWSQSSPKAGERCHRFLVDITADHEVIKAGDIISHRSFLLAEVLPLIEDNRPVASGNEFFPQSALHFHPGCGHWLVSPFKSGLQVLPVDTTLSGKLHLSELNPAIFR